MTKTKKKSKCDKTQIVTKLKKIVKKLENLSCDKSSKTGIVIKLVL